jgi:alcohol dehydrogenase class IV
MIDVQYYAPTRFYAGSDLFPRLTGDLGNRLGNRALLITEDILTQKNIVSTVQNTLEAHDMECIVFDEITTGSVSSAAEEAISIGRAGKAQIVIGLGDVTTLSIAKCVARMIPISTLLDDYLNGIDDFRKGIPFTAVPVTFFDPFLSSDTCLIVDAKNRETKILRSGEYPDTAVLDYSLMETLSEKESAYSILDILLVSLEGLFSSETNAVAEPLFTEALFLACSLLRDGIKHNDGTRKKAVRAGTLAAIGMSGTCAGLGSALSYALQGTTSLNYRWSAAILLPHIAEYFFKSKPERTEKLLNTIMPSADKPVGDISEILTDELRTLTAAADVPLRFRELDIRDNDTENLVEIIQSMGILKYVPGSVTHNDIWKIIRQAF